MSVSGDSGAHVLPDKKPTQVMTAWALILFGFLVQQSHQCCLRLLLHGQHLPEVGLRGCERGLLGLLLGIVFGEQILELGRRRVIVNGLLQRLGFGAGLRA